MKRDAEQSAGVQSGTSKKEKLNTKTQYKDDKGNYRPKKESEKASRGHVIR